MRRALAILLLGWAVLVAPLMPVGVGSMAAMAQEAAQTPDYLSSERVAARTEVSLRERRASNTALGQLRATLVQWRTIFLGAQDTNQARISTVLSQIESLGPEGTGAVPGGLATRRA